MEVKGWRLFAHPLFDEQLAALEKKVEALASAEPDTYKNHPASKLLETVRWHIVEIIPRDPNAPEFRQGNTLGVDNRHWFRAKFHKRYRLFFRFSSRVIVYVWMNDESGLRKAGAKTDPYEVFKTMLANGDPPRNLSDLLATARSLSPLDDIKKK